MEVPGRKQYGSLYLERALGHGECILRVSVCESVCLCACVLLCVMAVGMVEIVVVDTTPGFIVRACVFVCVPYFCVCVWRPCVCVCVWWWNW